MRSLSEIETVSKRSSRAAGYSWGIAEEVAKNIRLLEIFNLPGIKNLNSFFKIAVSSPTVLLTPKASLITIKAKTRAIVKVEVKPSNKKILVTKDTTKAECEEGIPPVFVKYFIWNSLFFM